MMPQSIPSQQTRDATRGWGWLEERTRAQGDIRYLARYREGGHVYSKTFLRREDAEGWLYTRVRTTPLQTPLVQRDVKRSICAVYFIQGVDGGPIKIGYARNPEARLKDLQLASPVQLRLLAIVDGGKPRETELHQRFAHLRSHGEWFIADESLVRWIRKNATT